MNGLNQLTNKYANHQKPKLWLDYPASITQLYELLAQAITALLNYKATDCPADAIDSRDRQLSWMKD